MELYNYTIRYSQDGKVISESNYNSQDFATIQNCFNNAIAGIVASGGIVLTARITIIS